MRPLRTLPPREGAKFTVSNSLASKFRTAGNSVFLKGWMACASSGEPGLAGHLARADGAGRAGLMRREPARRPGRRPERFDLAADMEKIFELHGRVDETGIAVEKAAAHDIGGEEISGRIPPVGHAGVFDPLPPGERRPGRRIAAPRQIPARLPRGTLVMAGGEMVQPAEIPMLERRGNFADGPVEHGMLVDLHVERAPARVVDALIKTGIDAE